MKTVRKLHLGCGNSFLPGYLNVDLSTDFEGTDSPDVIADVRYLSEFSSQSYDEVYVCHVLEHIPFTDIRIALCEWKRLLKKGGILKIAVPDLDQEIKHYLQDRPKNWQQRPHCESVFPGKPARTPSHQLVGTLVGGHVSRMGDRHCVPYNFEFLKEILEEIGFRNVRRYKTEIKDWSYLWPDSLNVQARLATDGEALKIEALMIESAKDIGDLKPILTKPTQLFERRIIFPRGGRQENVISLPIESRSLVNLLNGKHTVRSIERRLKNNPHFEFSRDLLLHLAAQRLLRFTSDKNKSGSQREFVLAPDLHRKFQGKVKWPVHQLVGTKKNFDDRWSFKSGVRAALDFGASGADSTYKVRRKGNWLELNDLEWKLFQAFREATTIQEVLELRQEYGLGKLQPKSLVHLAKNLLRRLEQAGFVEVEKEK